MKKYDRRREDLLIITFDDEKTTLNIIIDELKKGKFTIAGEPVYLQ